MIRRTRDDGFTLVELIVAMVVMAVVILMILLVQTRALTTLSDAQERQSSTAAANEAMEELRALPWAYLIQGLYHSFEGEVPGGDDPFYDSSTGLVTVNGASYTAIVAPSNTVHDSDGNGVMDDPWLPLYDAAGSNYQEMDSPSGNGRSLELRAYTIEDTAGEDGAVGLLVIATWERRGDGAIQNTVLTSTAYAPADGCGDLNNAPFLSSCQAYFAASASTADTSISIIGQTDDETNPVAAPFLPGSSFYSVQTTNANVSASIESQQVSSMDAFAVDGGVIWDDDLESTQPQSYGWLTGFASYSASATDDPTAGSGADDDSSGGYGSANELQLTALPFFYFQSNTDYSRYGSAGAHATSGCTGLTVTIADAPCAIASIPSYPNDDAFAQLRIDGQLIEFTETGYGSDDDEAWAARFLEGAGSASLGCDPSAYGADGCVASGASMDLGTIDIGHVASGNWTDPSGTSSAGTSLVQISGYDDSALAALADGVDVLSYSRSASVRYWNGSSTSNTPVGTGPWGSQVAVGPLEWSSLTATVTATGTITVTGVYDERTGTRSGVDACAESCTNYVANGFISVAIDYLIEPVVPGTFDPWVMSVTTTVSSSSASATYKAAASG